MKLIIFQVTDNASLESETGRTQAEKAFIQPQSLSRCKIGFFFSSSPLVGLKLAGSILVTWQTTKQKGIVSSDAPELVPPTS